MLDTARGRRGAILYVASRLPELSETFVYREFLGLRCRGRDMIAASVRRPHDVVNDATLAALRDEVRVIYERATLLRLPIALMRHPRIFIGAVIDAATADHSGITSRLKHLFQALMGISAADRLRGRNIGHVHAHMAHVPATVGLYMARTLDAGFSFTGHAADLFVDRSALAFKLDRAAFVACISNWHRDFYKQITGIADTRLPIVRCSVSVPVEALEENQEIVTVARLVPKKGIDLLLHAFASAKLTGWRLRILGDGPERPTLEALARDLGVADAVTFEGAQPHSVCLEAIAASGLFALPCRTAANGDKDGIPVVLMEAMAAQRPVIAGDLPAIRELVEGGKEGLLVPPDDPAALAEALRRLVADPALRKALGLAGRFHIQAEFADDINLDRLSGAFDRSAVTV